MKGGGDMVRETGSERVAVEFFLLRFSFASAFGCNNDNDEGDEKATHHKSSVMFEWTLSLSSKYMQIMRFLSNRHSFS